MIRAWASAVLSTAGLVVVVWGCGLDPVEETAGVPPTTGGAGGGGGAVGGLPTGGTGPGFPYADPYSVPAFDAIRISSHAEDENFHQATALVDFGEPPFASATLVIDLHSTCFPFESWQNNPPPEGHNWPADCDAFDRNFEWSLDDPEEEGDPPGLELARAITPFGGPLHLEIDITDVANGLPGEHRLRVLIPTYSDGAGIVSGSHGGWNVTARIDIVPGPAPREVVAVVPLFYGSQTELPGPGPISFDVPAGATSGKIEYRVTGHGGGAAGVGCIGPAEEFCKRYHEVFVDGVSLESFQPWRDNCDELCTLTHYGPDDAGFDYCYENPCGAVSSVNAPRANWCPGSLTPPFSWQPPSLGVPGPHDFDWDIQTIATGGQWRVSATYIGYGG